MEKKMSREIIFEQNLLAVRVTELEGKFNVEIAMLNGPGLAVEFDDELDAKGGYAVIETIAQAKLEALMKELIEAHEEDTILVSEPAPSET